MVDIQIGADIVKNSRLSNINLVKKFLTKREFLIYDKLESQIAKIEFAAGRWAAKEAIIKATNKKFSFLKIELLNDKSGMPYVVIDGKENKKIKISISHEKDYSIAFCLNFS